MKKDVTPLRERLLSLETLFDLAAKEKEQRLLEKRIASGDIWKDKQKAQETLKKLKNLKEITAPFKEMESSWEDLVVLTQLADEDKTIAPELERDICAFAKKLERVELRALLGHPHDRSNAYLSVHAGAGGTESCDWAAMLLRMYCRWMERNDYAYEVVDVQPGEEAGVKRAVVHVKGEWANGYLRAEVGVHRLVRISPFDTNRRRHTSFAAVDVVPEMAKEEEVEIRPEDVKVNTFRASGAGGQHVNKTSSAVRITHLPTGVVVQCQSERSQHKNRKSAMSMLMARLYQLKEKEREKEREALYDEKGEIAWGRQIRSYVLHPYNLVKDLRTGKETGNTQAVLDGEIDEFIDAYLRHKLEKQGS
ncbi:MAG: peptide chain release factor 2 [Candidatus Brocadiales bacterium]|nr:peptide chain release factor 2 [Candidatus Bathyanammoxibius sp.]